MKVKARYIFIAVVVVLDNYKTEGYILIDFSNEHIVITGGAGFLGQHLQKELVKCGASQEKLLIPLIED